MNKQAHRVSLRHLLALAALMLGATAFAGCVAAEPEPTDSDELSSSAEEDVGEAQEALICCTEGTFTCVSNGNEVDYGVPNSPDCPAITKPAAASACKASCGGVACHDSGWATHCF